MQNSPLQTQTSDITVFDVGKFLTTPGTGRTLIRLAKAETAFTQGEQASTLFYLNRGRIKIAAVSNQGKEAVIALLGPNTFFGEGCLGGDLLRTSTATALEDCSVMRMEKDQLLRLLKQQPALADALLTHMLNRSSRIEADLVDQLFNSSEKRLARALLLLADFGTETPAVVIPKISQETLAGMVGTTRSRVSFFMNKFRTLGFVKYGDADEHQSGALEVHNSLLKVLLHD